MYLTSWNCWGYFVIKTASLQWFLHWVWTLATRVELGLQLVWTLATLPFQFLLSDWQPLLCMGRNRHGLGNEQAHCQNLVVHLSLKESIPLSTTIPTSRCEQNVSTLRMKLTLCDRPNTIMAPVKKKSARTLTSKLINLRILLSS